MRRAARVDETQIDIVAALRKIGAQVAHLHTVGGGIPDLLFSFRGRTYLAECKTGSVGWKLTEAQRDFHANWPEKILIFTGVADVALWVNRQ